MGGLSSCFCSRRLNADQISSCIVKCVRGKRTHDHETRTNATMLSMMRQRARARLHEHNCCGFHVSATTAHCMKINLQNLSCQLPRPLRNAATAQLDHVCVNTPTEMEADFLHGTPRSPLGTAVLAKTMYKLGFSSWSMDFSHVRHCTEKTTNFTPSSTSCLQHMIYMAYVQIRLQPLVHALFQCSALH